ncbi:MAG: DNA alkylation repair protein [Pseudotabrizicola sp.]|uniref:DNA alkylation repair protein n=1 Tax=Pseudotabrizicola sp. TaxID=2939647 RepID=UPI002719A491|nr:DNA alkylation repair protein [Pseudotabrizicola sp.]MDO8884112.1 DNA alkylation repair protein [Pseudotabrizicola sp.]MDP2083029.1 DNA alkylation repair protein [Pseudotabrizicola sp.]MDZ7572447.1 DNA alkylation repair protein [Pseudotabrizicola sp.]
MTPYQALEALEALTDPAKAAEAAEYHKAPPEAGRRYLGLTPAQIDEHVATWRADLSVEGRVSLAEGLWNTDVHDARVAAAKLLTQARLRPDDRAWAVICDWVDQLDVWALADLVTTAGQKRVVADPARLADLEQWVESENHWVRRASLLMLLPWAKMNNLKDADYDIRETGLVWAEHLVPDRNWFIQKAIADWLGVLSKHDPARAAEFMDGPGLGLKTFARKEAARRLPEAPMAD